VLVNIELFCPIEEKSFSDDDRISPKGNAVARSRKSDSVRLSGFPSSLFVPESQRRTSLGRLPFVTDHS
jgi:hypothetical protein